MYAEMWIYMYLYAHTHKCSRMCVVTHSVDLLSTYTYKYYLHEFSSFLVEGVLGIGLKEKEEKPVNHCTYVQNLWRGRRGGGGGDLYDTHFLECMSESRSHAGDEKVRPGKRVCGSHARQGCKRRGQQGEGEGCKRAGARGRREESEEKYVPVSIHLSRC